MDKLTVQVTELCIKEGYRRNSTFCPIALAVKQATKLHIEVSGSTILLYEFTTKGSELIEYMLPIEAQQFIKEFDGYADPTKIRVQPFVFTAFKRGPGDSYGDV